MKKRFSLEQIVGVLKQAEVGVPVVELIRKAGISEQTFYRWKAKYVGLEVDQVRQMKMLQEENMRLKQLVAALHRPGSWPRRSWRCQRILVGTPPKYAKARTWPSRKASVVSAGNATTKQSSECGRPWPGNVPSVPLPQSPPALRRNPPAPRPAHASAAQTSPGCAVVRHAHSPSRSCSRP